MPKKESSPTLSTMAGGYLEKIKRLEKNRRHAPGDLVLTVDAKDLKALCASVLSQDETKGQRKTKAKPKPKRKIRKLSSSRRKIASY